MINHADFYVWLEKNQKHFVKSVFKNREETELEIKFEVKESGGWWDAVIYQKPDESIDYRPELMKIEYKSSVKEFGKDLTAFIRQIKMRNPEGERVFLVTPDKEFEKYRAVLKTENIHLIIVNI